MHYYSCSSTPVLEGYYHRKSKLFAAFQLTNISAFKHIFHVWHSNTIKSRNLITRVHSKWLILPKVANKFQYVCAQSDCSKTAKPPLKQQRLIYSCLPNEKLDCFLISR